MATSTELKRMTKIAGFLKKEGKPVDEFTLKKIYSLGASTYQQIKREAKLDPNYNWCIKIESERGQPDRWSYIAEARE